MKFSISHCILIAIVCFFVTGCTARLSPSDFEWMPYKGYETLVFESNKGETDTLFFLKKDTSESSRGEYGVSGNYESVDITYRSRNYRDLEGKAEYDYQSISVSGHKPAHLIIYLSTKDARYYGETWHEVDSLANVTPKKLSTSYHDYDDVYVFEPSEEDEEKYGNRSSYITKIYWSKTAGFVRYDKKGHERWELKKKYIKRDRRFAYD